MTNRYEETGLMAMAIVVQTLSRGKRVRDLPITPDKLM